MNQTPPTPLRAVGGFIYAGSFTLGMQRAGIDVLAHLEDPKPYAARTCQANIADSEGRPMPIFPYPWDLEEVKSWEPDILYGNPPCCAFSSIGVIIGRKGQDAWKAHPALQGTSQLFSAFRAVQPPFFAWESVMGSLTKGHPFISKFAREAIDLGYSFTAIPHNAYYHGSVQRRMRVIYVISKHGLLIPEPDYTRSETVMDRLATVEDPGRPCLSQERWDRTHAWLYPLTKPGQAMRNIYLEQVALGNVTPEYNKHGKMIGCPSISGAIRIKDNGPCNTVCGNPFIHPHQDRLLHVNEMAALADFPPDWDWSQAGSGVVSEMARGISPYVGEWLGEIAWATLTEKEPVTPGFSFVDLRYPSGSKNRAWDTFNRNQGIHSFHEAEAIEEAVEEAAQAGLEDKTIYGEAE